MIRDEIISPATALVGLMLVGIWIYKKRYRLFFQTKFVAETTMMNYQNGQKHEAMEEVAYLREEEREDSFGEEK